MDQSFNFARRKFRQEVEHPKKQKSYWFQKIDKEELIINRA
jgi:hypothetical protein